MSTQIRNIADAYRASIIEDVDVLNDRVTCNLVTRHKEFVRLAAEDLHDSLSAPSSSTTTFTSSTASPSLSAPSADLAAAYMEAMNEERDILEDRAAVSVAWRARDAARLHREIGGSKHEQNHHQQQSQSLIPGLDPSCAKAILRLHAFRSHLNGEVSRL
ncbi:hypothetical protein HDU96_008893 [Phlyctochytrium bullatum]|nr:hypothetical protein HDU96_008893 [Phlyctochytrium bullatum]